jgi:hypothetical protein
VPLAVAATLVLAASGVTLHLATGRSTTVLAAQLAADHIKCHLFEHDRGTKDAARVQDQLATLYGFHTAVPASHPALGLRLIGVRRCLTGKGTNAHILYRVDGRPVSLYFVTHRAREGHDLDVLGQRTHVWTRHNGTYVLVADPAVEGLPQIAAFMEEGTRQP